MGEFRVVPSSLDGATGRLASSGARIGEAGASLGATSGAGPATGDGEAAAAFATMLSTWELELQNVGRYAAGIGAATRWAASLYEAVDRSLFNFGSDGG